MQASILADQNIKYVDCVNVYEPIIKLFEKGGYFVYRERGMSFLISGFKFHLIIGLINFQVDNVNTYRFI